MKKVISERFFTIANKRVSEISKEEASKIAKTFLPSNDTELSSLITLLSFFDNKDDINYVVDKFTFKNTSNIKPVVRDIMRECRKTLFFCPNTLEALICKYKESLQYIIDIAEEAFPLHLLVSMMKGEKDRDIMIMDLVYIMSRNANHVNFPLIDVTLKEAGEVFFEESSKLEAINAIIGKKENQIKHFETLILLNHMKRKGLTFSKLKELSAANLSCIKITSFQK